MEDAGVVFNAMIICLSSATTKWARDDAENTLAKLRQRQAHLIEKCV